jgi:hypothetical protein
MRKKKRWRALAMLHLLSTHFIQEKPKRRRKKNSRQEVRKERKRERSLSLKKTSK